MKLKEIFTFKRKAKPKLMDSSSNTVASILGVQFDPIKGKNMIRQELSPPKKLETSHLKHLSSSSRLVPSSDRDKTLPVVTVDSMMIADKHNILTSFIDKMQSVSISGLKISAINHFGVIGETSEKYMTGLGLKEMDFKGTLLRVRHLFIIVDDNSSDAFKRLEPFTKGRVKKTNELLSEIGNIMTLQDDDTCSDLLQVEHVTICFVHKDNTHIRTVTYRGIQDTTIVLRPS